MCYVSGSYKANPYKFDHYGVSSLALEVNAKMFPKNPPTMKWSGSIAVTQAYLALFQNHCGSLQNAEIPVSMEEFRGGYGIFTFNLTPDNDTCMAHALSARVRSYQAAGYFSQSLRRSAVVSNHHGDGTVYRC